MKVILFGATGMVGQGVLRECLIDADVDRVLSIGRSSVAVSNPKFEQILRPDLSNYSDIETKLTGYDACFFCLGVSSGGMDKQEYERITFGITLAAAEVLCRLNPQMTFVYVTGMGTDSSEKGRVFWARIKGRTENALLRLPFKAAYMFRPGFIEPMHGVRSKTLSYRLFYDATRPFMQVMRWLFPGFILTTEQIGRAMLAVVRNGAEEKVLETRDIANLARSIS